MEAYHVNPNNGEVSRCQAKQGRCPYGGPEAHRSSVEAARLAYEATMRAHVLATVRQLSDSSSPRARARVQLETVHGSHLYGLARPTSDVDTYRVLANDYQAIGRDRLSLKTKQRIRGEEDVLETNLTEFLVKCEEGTPQALEAMFSRIAPPAPLDSYRHSYYLNTAGFAITYKRTIMNFARLGVEHERAKELLAPTEETEQHKKRVRESVRVKKPRRVERNGLLKYRRHSLRLMLNRETGLEFGRFNPTLSPSEKDFLLRAAELEDEKFATLVKSRVAF